MRRIRLGVVVCALAGWIQTAQAQERTVIHAARMLDVSRGVIVPNPAVVVEGGRIVGLGGGDTAGAEVRVP